MPQLNDPYALDMRPLIPHHQWRPIEVAQAAAMFRSAPFEWAIAGGHCVEQFVGRSFRPHEDVDVLIFRDQQLAAQEWLREWCLYAADPPGHLRRWQENEFLPFGVHDIWAHRPDSDAWQFQLMVAELDGGDWVYRNDSAIRGRRGDLITHYGGLPCVRIEVQLFYKSRGLRAKDKLDFEACLPLLSPDASRWLRAAIQHLFPGGHDWLAQLPNN